MKHYTFNFIEAPALALIASLSMLGSPALAQAAVCGDPTRLIHEIQGSGSTSPEVGNTHVVVGVVVGDFQDTQTELGGFYLQEEDSDADGDPATSEGLFVFDDGFGTDVNVGDLVGVQGQVAEFHGQTQITDVSDLAICSSGNPLPTPTTVFFPLSAVSDWERSEGMLINFPQTLFATDTFNQGRFGEVDVSLNAPLDAPTNVVAPGAPALALQDLNNRSRIRLDDGSTVQNPLPLPPYLGLDNTLRIGDSLTDLTGVLDERFNGYAVQPTETVNFTRNNARPFTPGDVGGAFKVASFNTDNYFTTLDNTGPICGPFADQGCRGADNTFEFVQQRAKIVSAIVALDADIVGLIGLENSAGDTAVTDLLGGLNAEPGVGPYDFIATGAIGTDAIRVGIIYKSASVTPLGSLAVLDSTVDPLFIDTKNRPVVAQTFQGNGTDTVVTVAVSHLKSKGSSCADVGDPDLEDGQMNCNLIRTDGATALVNWLATDPTASGSATYLIVGDLNAYAQEDPINAIEGAGYSDLVETFIGAGVSEGAYSYSFAGQSGYLDHALSSPELTPLVTGATLWHINADEPRSLDYNDFNQPALFNPDPFRASDHDAVIVGFCGPTPDFDNDGIGDGCDDDDDNDGVNDEADACANTTLATEAPTSGQLGKNRWSLANLTTFVQAEPQAGSAFSFDTGDTRGCSCAQIVDATDAGKGQLKKGCSTSVILDWVNAP